MGTATSDIMFALKGQLPSVVGSGSPNPFVGGLHLVVTMTQIHKGDLFQIRGLFSVNGLK